MSLNFRIAKRKNFKSEDLWAMHKLRAKVFKDRMGWEVPIIAEMEIDGYDAMEPAYMLIKNPSRQLIGCWRVLPTTGPYMLKDSFPVLLHGSAAPEQQDIWELSRFAIMTEGNEAFGFSTIVLESIREMMSHGMKHGIVKFVTVTTTAIERLLKRSGAVITRLGPPVQIGVENTVALYLDVQATYTALSSLALSGTIKKAA